MAETIIIGDSLERTVYSWNPLSSDPTKPDLTRPVDWTGWTVTFVIQNGSTTKTYSGSKVVLTNSEGFTELNKVIIALTPTDTAELRESNENRKSTSYLEFVETATQREVTRARRKEIIKEKADV